MTGIKIEYPLARIIKEGEIVQPVGAIKINLAITAAAHRHMREMVEMALLIGDSLDGKARRAIDDLSRGAIDGELVS